MPNDSRRATNHSYTSAGSRASTTTVIGVCLTEAAQNPAHSQPPRWGRARIAPFPPARAASIRSQPSTSIPASRSAGDVPGSRNDSTQYRA